MDIGFLNPPQSGFRPAFECGKEVRMVFLDISKAFDRVKHNGLLYKLELIGIRDPLVGWFKNSFSCRKQSVVIDGQSSNWSNINAGVPQGSVIGPLLFLIYITKNLKSDCLLYAYDTSVFDIVEDRITSLLKLTIFLRSRNGQKNGLLLSTPPRPIV